MRSWDVSEIPDLSGTTAVVTGANSGIGLHTALELGRAGARVIVACRDPQRGRTALGQLGAQAPGASFELVRLDLADLASVREAAEQITERTGGRLDVLVNNAGVMALPLRRTTDGFEMQFGTNHLGHFAFTGLLLPSLLAARAPRVVTVSSMVHRIGRIDFTDLNAERRYHKWPAYGQSKLANLLFTLELDCRAREAGRALRAVAAHPGTAATNLSRVGPQMSGRAKLASLAGKVTAHTSQSPMEGALPSLRAATDPQVAGGDYLGPKGFLEMSGPPTWVSPTAAARDRVVARRLWEASQEMTRITYPPM